MTNAAFNELLDTQLSFAAAVCLPGPLLTETTMQLSTQRNSGRICEDLSDEGISIEWHDFELDKESTLANSHACQTGRLRLCLNLAGHGSLCISDKPLRFGPLSVFIYAPGNGGLRGWRKPGERHRFLTIDFSADLLQSQFATRQSDLPSEISDFISSEGSVASVGGVVPLTGEHEQLISMLLRPQCAEGCCHLRCKGIALQLMAEFLMKPCCCNRATCDRQKCLGQERARKVIAILGRDLAEPPTIEAIGREIGCSPFYLSRTFSRELGMTIPQCLRTLRMRYAAELLRSGRLNVTEVAMAVGYSSLSHFSRVFCQAIGSCPGSYSTSANGSSSSVCANSCPSKNERSSGNTPRANKGSFPAVNVLLDEIGAA